MMIAMIDIVLSVLSGFMLALFSQVMFASWIINAAADVISDTTLRIKAVLSNILALLCGTGKQVFHLHVGKKSLLNDANLIPSKTCVAVHFVAQRTRRDANCIRYFGLGNTAFRNLPCKRRILYCHFYTSKL